MNTTANTFAPIALAVASPKHAAGSLGLAANRAVAAVAILLIAVLAAGAGQTAGWRAAALAIVGAGLGLSLFRASYGFAAGFRVFLIEGRGAHIRAQMIMLGAASLLFIPAIASGSVFGQNINGFVYQNGLAVVLGAFLFGIGMQLGGACASGTLYTAAGGGLRMLLTLAFFVAGATLAAYTSESWQTLPALPPYSLVAELGPFPALIINLTAFAAIYAAASKIEKRRTGSVEQISATSAHRIFNGPWPYLWGALALAALNFATLALAGRPWGITQAFALWGTVGIEQLGLGEPSFWAFWESPARSSWLHKPIFAEITSVMNFGLILGALAAAGLAGKFKPAWSIGWRAAAASVIGGLFLGFGSIMATGCNVSAYFSGIASGSLHGWLWLASALPGVWLGAKLRPLFRLEG